MKRRVFVNQSLLAITGSALWIRCKQEATLPSSIHKTDLSLEEITIDELQELYKTNKLSIEQATQWYLTRIQTLDQSGPALKSVLELNPEAITIAKQLDVEYKSGKRRGPLHGVPILIKDNINTGDQMMTTAGSLALMGHRAKKDAFIVEKLRAAGAVLLGKTNLSEWANFRSSRSSSGWSSRGGQTLNPYVLDRSPCGSSSGSGSATAANLCTISIGTETDGSIACPASINGLVGIKPTVGLWSRSGIIPISSTQDTAGPMTRTVTDAALLLFALAGEDKTDNKTIGNGAHIPPDYTHGLADATLQHKRLGIDRTLLKHHEGIDRLLADTLDRLRGAGAEIIEVDYMNINQKIGDDEYKVLKYEFKDGINKYLATADIDSIKTFDDIIRFNSLHDSTTMPYFKQEIMIECKDLGDLNTSEYVMALKKSHEQAKSSIDRLLTENKLDALIGPATGTAWCIDKVNGDRWTGYGAYGLAAVAGYPSITVPMGQIHELPVGMSFMGTAWDEHRLIQLAYAFEQLIQGRKKPRFLEKI